MKMLIGGLMALVLLGAGVQQAAAVDTIVITSQKKMGSLNKGKVGGEGSRAKDGETVHYEFKLQNQSLADISQLTITYLIFVERPKLGSRADQPSPVDRITGTQNIDVLSNRTPQTIASNEFTLTKSNLVGSYHYLDGGRIKVEDTVAGVWVRVMQNGQMIAEYANPPTVTKRGWDTSQSAGNSR